MNREQLNETLSPRLLLAAVGIAACGLLAACENAEENTEAAAEEVSEAAKTAADEVTEAAKAAKDATVDAAKATADAAEDMMASAEGEICEGFGPQTPRDITQRDGMNPVSFAVAPPASEMNLCNIHFHVNAEHKGPGFSVKANEVDRDGMKGVGGGYKCNIASKLTAAEKAPFEGNMCAGLKAGDTVEFHWVHSSCDVSPGAGLGSCLSEGCNEPDLRVETQVFTVVNDENAMDFADFRYAGSANADGFHQAKAIPTGTGDPVQFLGSTTGPKYTEQECSPLKVNWSVRPQCAKVSIQSLSAWCADNPFDEDAAHGVRKLVTNPALLSAIE